MPAAQRRAEAARPSTYCRPLHPLRRAAGRSRLQDVHRLPGGCPVDAPAEAPTARVAGAVTPFAVILARQTARIRGGSLVGVVGGLVSHVDRETITLPARAAPATCPCGCGDPPRARARYGPTPRYATPRCPGRLHAARKREQERAARPPRLCAAGCGRTVPTKPAGRLYCSAACNLRAYRRRRNARQPGYRRRERGGSSPIVRVGYAVGFFFAVSA